MQVSTLRSTTREDDKSDKSDTDSEDTTSRLMRSSARVTLESRPTSAYTQHLTPNMKPVTASHTTASTANDKSNEARPPRKRRVRNHLKNPEPPQRPIDHARPSSDDEAESRLPGRRSRSLSVIPTASMRPPTHPDPEDSAVRTLGFSQGSRSGSRDLSVDPETLVRMREGHFRRGLPVRQSDVDRNWGELSLSEAAWNHLEEAGCVGKGRAWTAREGVDGEGKPVKPELPYVMLTKLVIASSPRKMLTLNQIYQAMEERWPFFRSLGQTFRNSIRHNLSMNPSFVNVERPVCEGGLGTGKGGYWRVIDPPAALSRPKPKKARFDNEVTTVAVKKSATSTTAPEEKRPPGDRPKQKRAVSARKMISSETLEAGKPRHGHTVGPNGMMYPQRAPPLHLPQTDVQSALYIPSEYNPEHQSGYSSVMPVTHPGESRPGHAGHPPSRSVSTETRTNRDTYASSRGDNASRPYVLPIDKLHLEPAQWGDPSSSGAYPTRSGTLQIDPALEAQSHPYTVSKEWNNTQWNSTSAQLPTPPYEYDHPSNYAQDVSSSTSILPPLQKPGGDTLALPSVASLLRPPSSSPVSQLATPSSTNTIIPTPPRCV